MLVGETTNIIVDGTQISYFTYVDYALDDKLLTCNASTNAIGQVLNVATRHRFDLKETFHILKKLTGYSAEVQYAPERTGDVKHSLADISKAEKYLGYKPTVNFEQGLQQTVAWYRSQTQAAKV